MRKNVNGVYTADPTIGPVVPWWCCNGGGTDAAPHQRGGRCPTQRPLRRDAAQPSQESPPARRRRCHFLYSFSPTTSTTHPLRLTDQINRTCRTSQARPLLTLRLRHVAFTHTLSASDRPPPAASCTSATATRLCGESEICIPAPHPCAVTPRAMTAHPYSRRQLHLHMLGHAHTATSHTSQSQPKLHGAEQHSNHPTHGCLARPAH